MRVNGKWLLRLSLGMCEGYTCLNTAPKIKGDTLVTGSSFFLPLTVDKIGSTSDQCRGTPVLPALRRWRQEDRHKFTAWSMCQKTSWSNAHMHSIFTDGRGNGSCALSIPVVLSCSAFVPRRCLALSGHRGLSSARGAAGILCMESRSMLQCIGQPTGYLAHVATALLGSVKPVLSSLSCKAAIPARPGAPTCLHQEAPESTRILLPTFVRLEPSCKCHTVL